MRKKYLTASLSGQQDPSKRINHWHTTEIFIWRWPGAYLSSNPTTSHGTADNTICCILASSQNNYRIFLDSVLSKIYLFLFLCLKKKASNVKIYIHYEAKQTCSSVFWTKHKKYLKNEHLFDFYWTFQHCLFPFTLQPWSKCAVRYFFQSLKWLHLNN